MPSQQLDLWDNESLETGYRLLSNLELKEAELQFNEALNGALGDTANVLQAIEACKYWRSMIKPSSELSENDPISNYIDSLLSTYMDYPFTQPMKQFRRRLLRHIVSLLREVDQMNLKSVEITFDLLLEIKDYDAGESLMEEAIGQYPHNPELHYLLAQAKWLNGDQMKANKTYAWLLLYYPAQLTRQRIENKELLTLIDIYGAAMAPAYGWLHQVVPLIFLSDEIHIYDDDHDKAIECYRLILSANKSMRDRDVKTTTQYRKKLKELSPELFEEYFRWVQRQG